MELDLVHLKLNDDELTFEDKEINKLYLRQNNLELSKSLDIEGNKLEEIDLYDNKISDDNLILDLSFNLIRSIKNLEKLPLKELYLVQNKIVDISNLNIPTLELLELGGNRIRTIQNLDYLSNLRELWLGKNKITEIANMDNLSNLRILSLQANRISDITGLDGLTNLEELYLSHNNLSSLQGLDNLTQLNTLDIAHNKIETISNVKHLKNLKEFWANSNKITSLEEIESEFKDTPLETIYLEHNPVQQTLNTQYRLKLKLALPQLKQIDATLT
ncbi:L domain-like protein [Wallemia mellicola]|uniref:L domain-like protein n=1 Tax=Wallemia mellicola TaxID=1708541 RepID=A0AB38MXY8_9BASI|nr:L domain-like protein [Wallemia mellicola]TIC69430.1 L domain-like protein [Wallemia mellicola]